MKLKSKLLTALAVSAFAVASSQGALIAYWNFNELEISSSSIVGENGVPETIAATQGNGTISLSGWDGLVNNFVGSTINALDSDPAGASLSLISETGNGSHIDISISTIDLTDVVVTFATRGTGTGYDSGLWSYSTDGGTEFTASGLDSTATRDGWVTATADFTGITAVENQSSVILRYTLDGATSTAGNNRIDNLQINAVPEPTTALLGGLGLLVLLRRRR